MVSSGSQKVHHDKWRLCQRSKRRKGPHLSKLRRLTMGRRFDLEESTCDEKLRRCEATQTVSSFEDFLKDCRPSAMRVPSPQTSSFFVCFEIFEWEFVGTMLAEV